MNVFILDFCIQLAYDFCSPRLIVYDRLHIYFGLMAFLIILVINLQVIDKFFQIRQGSLEEFEDTSWDDKCTCLLHDPDEMWSFNDASTSKYIVRF